MSDPLGSGALGEGYEYHLKRQKDRLEADFKAGKIDQKRVRHPYGPHLLRLTLFSRGRCGAYEIAVLFNPSNSALCTEIRFPYDMITGSLLGIECYG